MSRNNPILRCRNGRLVDPSGRDQGVCIDCEGTACDNEQPTTPTAPAPFDVERARDYALVHNDKVVERACDEVERLRKHSGDLGLVIHWHDRARDLEQEVSGLREQLRLAEDVVEAAEVIDDKINPSGDDEDRLWKSLAAYRQRWPKEPK